MMKIDIRKLNAQKKYSGTMQFHYEAPNSLIDIPFVEFQDGVNVEFRYELYEDNAFEIEGKISYRLIGKCSRCLNAATADVEGELTALFEDRKDFEDYSYANGVVDLQKAVDDAIMASMPFSVSCGDSCKGLTYSDEPSK